MATETHVVEAAGRGAGNHEGVAYPAADAAAPGMPQLDFSTFPNQIFWLVLTLIAIYLLVAKFALPRIGGVLADRRKTIESDISAAEDIRRKAVEAEEAYNKALSDARAQARDIIAEAKAAVQKDLDAANAEADAEIAASAAEAEKSIAEIRSGADRMVSEVAHEIAQDIVAAAVPGMVDEAEIAAAVDRRVKGGA